jgi:hypothetical protein
LTLKDDNSQQAPTKKSLITVSQLRQVCFLAVRLFNSSASQALTPIIATSATSGHVIRQVRYRCSLALQFPQHVLAVDDNKLDIFLPKISNKFEINQN